MSQAFPQRQQSWLKKILGLVVLIILTAACLVPAFQEVRWLDERDVEFDFVVVDAATGHPVGNATINLFRDEPQEEILQVCQTGPDGHASMVQTCWSAGRGNAFRDTSMSVNLLPWSVSVSAGCYRTKPPVWLLDYRQMIIHRERSSLLPVRIELQRDERAGNK
jgi:hypothetical protein